ncbi:MAG: hypothetical protein JO235_07335 [Chroococcidiopsidaceae cyanobacterium CP_BM_RX_35]|nr:hypothetical protein [Chroococcidiopsidaceae cyanobacterium CP_BM_RX_35]
MNRIVQGLTGLWILTWGCCGIGKATAVPNQPAIAPLNQVAPSSTCPADVKTLTTELLRDLPSYANRISQSSRPLNSRPDLSTYVVLAGRPEFAPLTLGPGEYLPSTPGLSPQQEPQQVFITTLERQYTAGKAIELQQYHWLFLTRTSSGWQLSMMFSRTGPYRVGRPLTPPRDSSNGVIAQAIRTWLRDCRAGAVSLLG